MFLTHSLWLNLLIIIGLVGGAEEVVRRLVGKPVARVWKKVERFLDTWNGEPARDGLAARPGLVDRVIAIEYQVHNNGGGSMKDTVDRLATSVGTLNTTVDRIETATELAATKATTAATKAEESALVATATKAALDEHVEQSKVMVEQGAADKAALWLNAEEHSRTISELAKAVQIAAQSTPPEDH